MDRSTGTPWGVALLVLLLLGFGWALTGHRDHDDPVLSSFGTSATASDFAAAQQQPVLVWPRDLPEPMTAYVGRRVMAAGLRVTSVDADEGFWVEQGGRTAWVQLETATESPYTVRPGDVVTLSGTVTAHDARFPSGLYFCPDRQASAGRLAQVPTHIAVGVDSLEFGIG
jgi:hypothetical protein